ncbi:hypothetical protein D3C76_1365570 [compost metagenome]
MHQFAAEFLSLFQHVEQDDRERKQNDRKTGNEREQSTHIVGHEGKSFINIIRKLRKRRGALWE